MTFQPLKTPLRRDRYAWRTLAGAALLALIPAAGTRVVATTIARMSLAEVVAASDTIVQGRVEGARSFWRGNQVWTEVTLAVSQGLKGTPGGRLTFEQLGGRVDAPVPLEMSVPGLPEHRAGDEGFYFLQAGGPGQRVIVGLSLGLVRVLRDDRGAYVGAEGRRRSPVEFAEEIRRLVAGQASRRSGGAAER
jgi:hypothetical protein